MLLPDIVQSCFQKFTAHTEVHVKLTLKLQELHQQIKLQDVLRFSHSWIPLVGPATLPYPFRMILIFGDTVLLPLALAWDVPMGVGNIFSAVPLKKTHGLKGGECPRSC